MSASIAASTQELTRSPDRSPAGAGHLWQRVAIAVLVLCTFVAPISVVSEATERYVGIAPDGLTVYGYTLVVLALLPLALRHHRALLPACYYALPFVLAVTWLALFEWDSSSRIASGLLHVATAVAAFLVALFIARWYENSVEEFALAVCGALFLQAFFVLLEMSGVYRRSLAGPQDPELVGRAIGLADHPNQLARIMFVGLIFALVLIGRQKRWRRLGVATIIVAMACIGLSESRTALIAAVLLLLLYFSFTFFLGRHRALALGLLVGVAAVVLPQLSTIIDRFELDPTGGARPYLNEVAFYSIDIRPWVGVGVNEYVNTVGALDLLTASGVPVHNVFLLSAAELGVVAAVALWAPFAVAAIFAFRRVRSDAVDAVSSQVLLAALPSLALLGLTNWGLMQGSMFVVLAIVTGFLGGSMTRQRTAVASESRK